MWQLNSKEIEHKVLFTANIPLHLPQNFITNLKHSAFDNLFLKILNNEGSINLIGLSPTWAAQIVSLDLNTPPYTPTVASPTWAN